MVAELEVLNPVSQIAGELSRFPAAPRPPNLAGKRVGLYWNYKPGGVFALHRVGEVLESRFPGLKAKLYAAPRPVPKKVLEAIRDECDVVIGSTAD